MVTARRARALTRRRRGDIINLIISNVWRDDAWWRRDGVATRAARATSGGGVGGCLAALAYVAWRRGGAYHIVAAARRGAPLAPAAWRVADMAHGTSLAWRAGVP